MDTDLWPGYVVSGQDRKGGKDWRQCRPETRYGNTEIQGEDSSVMCSFLSEPRKKH